MYKKFKIQGKSVTQEQRRLFLIRELLSEEPEYRELDVPETEEGQKRLLRSLMNLRPPRPADAEFIRVQDAYLREEVRKKGIVSLEELSASPMDSRLLLWRGDITTLKADAIVNAANSALLGCFVPCHSCVDNIIHSVSGIGLRLACHALMSAQGHPEPTGRAQITPAFNLPCKYVLHTVGPVITGPLTERDCGLLSDCYRSCLKLACENGLKSVAFCCISTGEFHFPQEKAAEIALQAVTCFLDSNTGPEKVVFNVFKREDEEIYRKLLKTD